MAKPLNLLEQRKLYPNKGDKIVSYSQFEKWAKCPRNWYLSYVQKKSIFQQNIHATFGTAMHEALQHYLKLCFTKSVKAADEFNMDDYFFEVLKREYLEAVKKNGDVHFSNPQEIHEFYGQGLAIIKSFKKNRRLYFSTRDMVLVGIETESLEPIIEGTDKVKFRIYIDILFYDKTTDKYIIVDFKTSTKGWGDYEKKDEIKRSQLLIYKREFSKKFNIPEDKIEVKFLILRRNVEFDYLDFPLKRIQEYIPPQSERTTNKLYNKFLEFVNICYTSEGVYNEDETQYPAIAGENHKNCRFCDFKDNEELCPSKNRKFN